MHHLGRSAVAVAPGDTLRLEACHNTYSLSFRLEGTPQGVTASASTQVATGLAASATGSNGASALGAAADPVWLAHYQALQPLNAAITKACAQVG